MATAGTVHALDVWQLYTPAHHCVRTQAAGTHTEKGMRSNWNVCEALGGKSFPITLHCAEFAGTILIPVKEALAPGRLGTNLTLFCLPI